MRAARWLQASARRYSHSGASSPGGPPPPPPPPPSPDEWQQYTDPASGNPYYYHVPSRTTTWECPPGFTQRVDPLGDRRQRAVPASPIERVWGFASLGADLFGGAAVELARRAGGGGSDGSALLNPRNADVLAAELCRMRGAALKIGQMLSVQDESFLPKPMADALRRVRTHADVMPTDQLEQVLADNLGCAAALRCPNMRPCCCALYLVPLCSSLSPFPALMFGDL